MPRERKRPIAEECRQIAVSQVLAPGERARLRWEDGASVTLERQDGATRIGLRWRDDDGRRVTGQIVRLVADTPYLGGTCFYFGCPDCGRRALKLFEATIRRFACRHYGGLANRFHRFQSEGAWAGMLRHARKLRCYLVRRVAQVIHNPAAAEKDADVDLPSARRRVQTLEAIPLRAWLSDGRSVRLGVRRDMMDASKRRWCSDRNAAARSKKILSY